jgi:hypothetical protein
MNTRRLVIGVALTILMTGMSMVTAIPEAVATPAASRLTVTHHSLRTVAIPISHPGERVKPVDCIGDGASCVGYVNRGGDGNGEVDVTNNTNPHDYWRFKLTCEHFGDQYSGDNHPSASTVRSYLKCNASDAKFWTVLVDYRS